MASGGPGQWALPTTGTGIIGAPGAPTFVGPGQWASPTTGTGISGVSFAQREREVKAVTHQEQPQRETPVTGQTPQRALETRAQWARGSCRRVWLFYRQEWVQAEWVASDRRDNRHW
jgi:hypothetical protein